MLWRREIPAREFLKMFHPFMSLIKELDGQHIFMNTMRFRVQSHIAQSPRPQCSWRPGENASLCLHVIRLRIFLKKNHTAASSGDLRHSRSQSPHLLHGHVIARYLETHHQMEHSTVCSVHSHDEVRAKAIRMVIIIRTVMHCSKLEQILYQTIVFSAGGQYCPWRLRESIGS